MPRASDTLPRWVLDARLALPLLLIGLIGTAPAGENQPDWTRSADHYAYLLVIVAALTLLGRRPFPGLALAVNTVAVGIYLAVGYPFGPILLTVPVMAFAIAATWPRRQAVWGVLAAMAALLVATVVRSAFVAEGDVWWPLARSWLVWLPIVAALFAIGATARVRRESAAGVRAEQARRAASEEQLRMAQELHDVVGHGLAVIAMQAGVALHVLDRDPAKVRESLEAIRAMSRESLDGLRTELAQLRATADDAPARRPMPGLADVDVLVHRIRAGGIDVHLTLDGDVEDVPAPVSAAAYRIVQESLTNVLRHAHADDATVHVTTEGDALLVEVTDRGRGGEVNGDGSGIRGMRERAEALGGSLAAGPGATGGFGVRARLPLVPQQPVEPVTSEADR